MIVRNKTSHKSVQEFRAAVVDSFEVNADLLLNIIDALVVGPAPGSPVDLFFSPVFAYGWSSIYQGISRAEEALGPLIDSPDWLSDLRKARLAWLLAHPSAPWRPDLGKWKIRILDATNHYRPQLRTVEISYVHGADGMKPGSGWSVLAERVGPGSWTLPLEIGWMPVEGGPTIYGGVQMKTWAEVHGWEPEAVLAVDAQYPVRTFLEPVIAAGVNVLGRVRNNRVFYLPRSNRNEQGRPGQLGDKLRLSDPTTHPPPDQTEQWSLPNGGRVEARCWRDVRQKGLARQPLTLYQVIEYKADGQPRYKRPLWLLFAAGKDAAGLPVAAPPTPREAEAIYDERFSVEHFLRFAKQELGLVSSQFNSEEAERREQTWVELVATAFWMLWSLRAVVDVEKMELPAWWTSQKLTPGAMRRLAAGLFIGLGWERPEVKPRGKSPGRTAGETQTPRTRYKTFRAGA